MIGSRENNCLVIDPYRRLGTITLSSSFVSGTASDCLARALPDVRRARLQFLGAHNLHNASAADITSALGRHLKNQTTCLFGLRPPVGVEDRPIYAPAYRTGARPSDVKLAPGARRRMRTVS